MKEIQNTFMRYEIKYLITDKQRQEIMELVQQYMEPDEFGRSTICNVYYDTPDMRLIRRSLEKPIYKEKLRLRSYGNVTADGRVFVELKKKYQDVVFKRRVSMKEDEAVSYLAGESEPPKSNQITGELDYFLSEYEGIRPTVFIAYDRTAFFGREDRNFRITFDENIRWRDRNLGLSYEVYGNHLLEADQSLMEIKVLNAMPLWLAHKLCELSIYKTAFSKYGNAYKAMMSSKAEGGYCCA